MKKNSVLLFSFLLILFFTCCKKIPDKPPVGSLSAGKNYSAPELKAIASCTNACQKRFTSDVYFCGVVIADEVSGNFYKEIYVRDRYNTGAIRLAFLASKCNFFIGDSVRLNLKGFDVNLNSGMLEVDSIDYEKYMVKYASGANPQPIVVNLSQTPYSNYYCDLVTLNNVKFNSADANQIYADPILQESLSRVLQDCGGNAITVRTSNFADFAQQKTPSGFGSITGIATAYQQSGGSVTQQMAIRTTSEVNMNGTGGCISYLTKDFNDASLTSGGWSQVSVAGVATWSASSFGSAKFAKIPGAFTGNATTENWLISPAINLSAAVSPILTFATAAKFPGNLLEVWVSTNYVSGAPSTASWTQLTGFILSPNNSTSNYVWTASGIVALNTFINANTRIAFKYTSTTSATTTWEVDDVIIREN